MKLFKKRRRAGKEFTFARPLNAVSTESQAADVGVAHVLSLITASALALWAYFSTGVFLSLLAVSAVVAYMIFASHPSFNFGGKKSRAVGYHYFGELSALGSSLEVLRSKFLKYGDLDSDDALLLNAALSLFNQTVLKAEKNHRELRKIRVSYAGYLPAIKKSRKATLERNSRGPLRGPLLAWERLTAQEQALSPTASRVASIIPSRLLDESVEIDNSMLSLKEFTESFKPPLPREPQSARRTTGEVSLKSASDNFAGLLKESNEREAFKAAALAELEKELAETDLSSITLKRSSAAKGGLARKIISKLSGS